MRDNHQGSMLRISTYDGYLLKSTKEKNFQLKINEMYTE